MTSIKRLLLELAVMLISLIVLTTVLWPLTRGPVAVALAVAGSWISTSAVRDRLANRAVVWRTALAQALVCGFAAWVMLRWLDA